MKKNKTRAKKAKGLTQIKAGQTHQVKKILPRKDLVAEQIVAEVDARELAEGAKEFRKRQSILSIGETKLGVTLVLNKEDCKELGFDMTLTSREVIRSVRERLGLKPRKRDEIEVQA